MASTPNHGISCIHCSNTNIKHGTKSASILLNKHVSMKNRQNIPKKIQLVDPYRQGMIVDDDEGVGYKQIVTIRSNEVGPDKTATIDSILNLLQETGLNQLWMSGHLSDGFGRTHKMVANDLIWVVSKMQLQVDHYPVWGEVMEIRTWVGASGKHGMQRNWVVRGVQGQATGIVFLRGTCTCLLMNQTTRRFSKMPDEVRAELSPWFTEKQAFEEDYHLEKINFNLDSNSSYVSSNLKPTRSDLDMNNHVNNVKYLKWILEPIPDEFLENYELSNVILEYRKECSGSDVVQSICEPGEGNPFSYNHLLHTKMESGNEEILRGKTTWRRKLTSIPFTHSKL